MDGFLQALRVQRWDDHRYYHHSRINQSLHLVSAIELRVRLCRWPSQDPAMAALIGWLVAMTSRQAGHFFFEPRDYDHVNHATHEHKEEIKVGYNLTAQGRADGDLGAVAAAAVSRSDAVRHVRRRTTTLGEFLRHVALIWLAIGLGGLLFRTVHLFFIKDVQTGLVWATKILTDPFHDIKLYHKAPLYLMRGELIDTMTPKTQGRVDDSYARHRRAVPAISMRDAQCNGLSRWPAQVRP